MQNYKYNYCYVLTLWCNNYKNEIYNHNYFTMQSYTNTKHFPLGVKFHFDIRQISKTAKVQLSRLLNQRHSMRDQRVRFAFHLSHLYCTTLVANTFSAQILVNVDFFYNTCARIFDINFHSKLTSVICNQSFLFLCENIVASTATEFYKRLKVKALPID